MTHIHHKKKTNIYGLNKYADALNMQAIQCSNTCTVITTGQQKIFNKKNVTEIVNIP